MRIPRFYQNTLLAVDQTVKLNQDTAHYIHNVLRLQVSSPIVLFNGDGNEYSAEIVELGKRNAIALVDAKLSLDVQSPLKLHLGQAVSKGDRMELAIQKATELGVTEITPVITERCNVKLNKERWQKKHEQWLKMISAACEQCGRNTLPVLNSPVLLTQWLSLPTQATRLIFDLDAEKRMADVLNNANGFHILVGPEGGLTEQEIYAAKQAGYIGVLAGPRTLRTETAAMAAVAVLQSMYGDM